MSTSEVIGAGHDDGLVGRSDQDDSAGRDDNADHGPHGQHHESAAADEHDHPQFAGLDAEKFHRYMHEAFADPLYDILRARKADVVTHAWEELGVSGLLELFKTLPSRELETFLRDYRTSAPRRPGPAEAHVIFRKGKSEGIPRLAKMLWFLGQQVARAVTDAAREGNEDLEQLRTLHSDVVLRAALIGGIYKRGAFPAAVTVGALSLMGLLSPDLDDPLIVELADGFSEALHARREAARSTDEQDAGPDLAAEPDLATETLAIGAQQLCDAMVAAGCDLDLVDARLGAFRAAAKAGAAAARRTGAQLEDGQYPKAKDRTLIEAALIAADELTELLARALEVLEVAGAPRAEVVGEALELARANSLGGPARLVGLCGPASIEAQLAEIRQAAVGGNPEIADFLSVLCGLIHLASDADADPNVLAVIEQSARDADREARFSAVLTAAVRGTLRIEEPVVEGGEEAEGAAAGKVRGPVAPEPAAGGRADEGNNRDEPAAEGPGVASVEEGEAVEEGAAGVGDADDKDAAGGPRGDGGTGGAAPDGDGGAADALRSDVAGPLDAAFTSSDGAHGEWAFVEGAVAGAPADTDAAAPGGAANEADGSAAAVAGAPGGVGRSPVSGGQGAALAADEARDSEAEEEAEFEAALDVQARLDGGVEAALDVGALSLAAWACVAAARESGGPVPETTALEIAALAAQLHGPGPLAAELAMRMSEMPRSLVGGSFAVQLCTWAAALRASVIAPETGVHELAAAVAQRLDVAAIATLSDAVVSFARRGLSLLRASSLSTAGDLSSLEEGASLAADSVAEQLVMHQFNFPLAGKVWRDWISSGGALGGLAPAASDDRRQVDTVRSVAEGLRSRRAMERALDETERRVRDKSTSKSIEGSTRQSLLRHGAEVTAAALDWCDAVDALVLRQRASTDSDEQAITKLVQTAKSVKEEVLLAIDEAGPGSNGASQLIDALYELLAGKQPDHAESKLEVALHQGLLFGDQALGVSLRPVGPLTLDAVLAGIGRSIDEAFELRLAARDLEAAYGLAELARAAGEADPDAMERRCDQALEVGRQEVSVKGAAAARLLDRARRQLYVTEDTYAAFSGRLDWATAASRKDVGRQLSELEAITLELGAARDQAVAQFAADARERCERYPGALARVLALVETGDLATATELIQQAERGEDLDTTDTEEFAIEKVFPVAPAAMGEAMHIDLIDAARARGTWGPLEFGGLNERTAADVTAALEAWADVHHAPAPGDPLEMLKPVLRLMGIEAKSFDRRATAVITSSAQRRWFDLTGVSRTGKALVPFFGSGSEDRLRCVWVTGMPGAETLCEWIEQDLARRPVLVVHPGVMAMAIRLTLARLMRRRGLQPAVVVDDAVVAWLATLGQSRFEPFMRATLPFSAGNPYMPPSGDCPIEMFYGRSTQLAKVQAIDGTCLVYGGRQLGKSALLRTAEREFNQVHDQVAVYVNLKPPVDEGGRSEVVWVELAEKLTAAGVMAHTRSTSRDPMGAVSAAVNAWLDERPQGRILVLLDEADRYFDLDAQANFVTTSRLKDLMDEKGRRFKVVWTGLHQVRRFATVSNHPIAHLGTPAVIGFLDPEPASRLIVRPCGALGLRFSDPDLVNRILAYCNYQPALLHLFAHALVQRMCVQGADRLVGVPVMVTDHDVEEVAGSPTLQEAIKEKLELTLELDPRYKVITYTLAYLAHHHASDMALGAPALRAEARRWWPAGFSSVDASEFRSLLEELAGLGVLSADPSGGGWRLRSANVLRLLGTAEQVEDALLQEEEREPVPLESSEVRERLDGRHHSPITRAQLLDLLGPGHSQVFLVVGSQATCADLLADALDAASKRLPRFVLSRPKNQREFKRALGVPAADGQHVVFSDLRRGVKAETCQESLRLALRRGPGAPAAAVALLVDASGLEWWLPLVSPDADDGVLVLGLRRFDRLGARAWSATYEDVFQDEASRQRLLDLTGGWPVLFDRADRLIATGAATSSLAVLDVLRGEIDAGRHDETLVSALQDAMPPVLGLYDILAANSEEAASVKDLAELVQSPDCDALAVIEALRTLGVVSTSASGDLSAEPVLARAWRRRG